METTALDDAGLSSVRIVPDVSVVVCTHNRSATLEHCLPHLTRLLATAGFPCELIVVDNGSTDSTQAVLARLQADSPFRVLYEPRLGHAIALNAGWRAASGSVIAFTDDDALPGREWLARIHHELFSGTANWIFGPVDPVWEGTAPPWYGPRTMSCVAALDYGQAPFVATTLETPFFGVNHAGKKADLEALGGFNEDHGGFGATAFGIGNDIDLYTRLVASGTRIRYDPEMRVEHLVSAKRATTAHHRRMIPIVARGYARYLAQDRPYGRGVAGVPRWMVRSAVEHWWGFLRTRVSNQPSEAFYYEVQSRRFLWIFFWAIRSLVPLPIRNRRASAGTSGRAAGV